MTLTGITGIIVSLASGTRVILHLLIPHLFTMPVGATWTVDEVLIRKPDVGGSPRGRKDSQEAAMVYIGSAYGAPRVWITSSGL